MMFSMQKVVKMKIIKNLKKHFTGSFLILLAIVYALAVQSCHAQKHHHKAVPCPCEKKRK